MMPVIFLCLLMSLCDLNLDGVYMYMYEDSNFECTYCVPLRSKLHQLYEYIEIINCTNYSLLIVKSNRTTSSSNVKR